MAGLSAADALMVGAYDLLAMKACRAKHSDATVVLEHLNPDFPARPNGAVHQWKEDPPRKLSVGPGS